MSDGNKRYPSELAPKFVLRFPQGMREEIREIAASNRRSMTAEIIARLEQTLTSDHDGQVSHLIQEADVDPYFNELASEEQQLVALYRQLPDNKRRALMALLA